MDLAPCHVSLCTRGTVQAQRETGMYPYFPEFEDFFDLSRLAAYHRHEAWLARGAGCEGGGEEVLRPKARGLATLGGGARAWALLRPTGHACPRKHGVRQVT